MMLSGAPGGVADIEVKIKGSNMKVLFDLVRKISEAMNGLKYFRSVYVSMDLTKPEYQIRVDRTQMASLGVTAADVAAAAQTLLSGAVPTRFKDGEDFYNICLRMPEKEIVSRQDVENLIRSRIKDDYLGG